MKSTIAKGVAGLAALVIALGALAWGGPKVVVWAGDQWYAGSCQQSVTFAKEVWLSEFNALDAELPLPEFFTQMGVIERKLLDTIDAAECPSWRQAIQQVFLDYQGSWVAAIDEVIASGAEDLSRGEVDRLIAVMTNARLALDALLSVDSPPSDTP